MLLSHKIWKKCHIFRFVSRAMSKSVVEEILNVARKQMKLMAGGGERKTMKKTFEQKIAMSLSCWFYLIPCITYFLLSDPFGGYLYLNVTVWSTLADGSWAPKEIHFRIQVIDKWSATLAGAYTLLTLLMSRLGLLTSLCAIFVTAFALFFLKLSREIGAEAKKPNASSKQVWKWVLAHSMWHLTSSIAVAFGGYVVQVSSSSR
mmetsp:Transcript_15843/g.23880  ORF Transcript_15843/g.23880 Transcript_15843/m.23880 type:complete len:204 (+) Transcript_15843:91-702(+)